MVLEYLVGEDSRTEEQKIIDACTNNNFQELKNLVADNPDKVKVGVHPSPLIIACQCNKVEIFEYLLKLNYDEDLSTKNNMLIYDAVKYNNPEIFALLYQRPEVLAKIAIENNKILRKAILNCNYDIVATLLKNDTVVKSLNEYLICGIDCNAIFVKNLKLLNLLVEKNIISQQYLSECGLYEYYHQVINFDLCKADSAAFGCIANGLPAEIVQPILYQADFLLTDSEIEHVIELNMSEGCSKPNNPQCRTSSPRVKL